MQTLTHRSILWLFSLVCLALWWGQPGQVVTADTPAIAIVQLTPNTTISDLQTSYNFTVQTTIPPLNLYRLAGVTPAVWQALANDGRVLTLQAEQFAQARPSYINATGDVLQAQPSYINATGQNVTTYNGQPAVNQLRLSQAHTLTTGQGVTVAILDTGVDLTHPLLINQLVPGYDILDNDPTPADVGDGLDNDGDGQIDEAVGHGSHVAGVVALVAPQARLMPIRIFNSDGLGSYFDVANGIVYAVEHGAQVINLSGNGGEDSPVLQQAVAYAHSQGVVVVAAAGVNRLGYPASYPQVLSVAATDAYDYRLDFANFPQNSDVSVYAPGYAIFSAYANGRYAWWTGHSMATPFVAGEAALLRALPNCQASCATTHITQATRPVNHAHALHGRADVYDAVGQAAGQTTPNLRVQYRPGTGDTPDNLELKPFFRLVNEGHSINLDQVKIRYWFADAPSQTHQFTCDFSAVGCANVQGQVYFTGQSTGTNHYLELTFPAAAGRLLGGTSSGLLETRLNHGNWSDYAEGDDYSYTNVTEFVDWARVTVYYQGQLVWGQEPVLGAAAPPAGATPLPTVALQYQAGDTTVWNGEARPYLRLVNHSSQPIPYAELTIRYWYAPQYPAAPLFACDYAQVGCDKVVAQFNHSALNPYLELKFTAGAGSLPAGGNSGNLQLRFHQPDWQTIHETAHYSFDGSKTEFTNWEQVTVYHNGQLVWGVEP